VLRDILAWHRRGTHHGIRQDEDGLLYGGEEGVQLTWMDARAGNRVITPRRGKPVEIQALWYNALRILADLRRRFGGVSGAGGAAASLEEDAERARRRFVELFWNAAADCLYDCVDQRDGAPAREVDRRVRPNQILALALPFELLDPARAASVLRVVEAKLLTPLGLRSLAPEDPDYRPRYEGGPEERDGAYHQGPVWSWLLGPFTTALVRQRGEAGRLQARRIVEGAAAHLAEACVGSVSEIFDAEPPFRPRGCPAQAWGVAEWLRAAVEEAGLESRQ
jgi:predicted glycogen debranching enzyme